MKTFLIIVIAVSLGCIAGTALAQAVNMIVGVKLNECNKNIDLLIKCCK